MILETITVVAILVGATFTLVGSIGLARLPDFFTRLHGPTKATTLGLGCLLVASVLWFSRDGSLSLHEALITLFLFLSAPVSALLMAKAALHLGMKAWTGADVAAATADSRVSASSESE